MNLINSYIWLGFLCWCIITFILFQRTLCFSLNAERWREYSRYRRKKYPCGKNKSEWKCVTNTCPHAHRIVTEIFRRGSGGDRSLWILCGSQWSTIWLASGYPLVLSKWFVLARGNPFNCKQCCLLIGISVLKLLFLFWIPLHRFVPAVTNYKAPKFYFQFLPQCHPACCSLYLIHHHSFLLLHLTSLRTLAIVSKFYFLWKAVGDEPSPSFCHHLRTRADS